MIGLSLPLRGWSAADAVELSVRAEAFGYDSVWVSEFASFDALVVAGAVLQRVPRIRVGTAVVPIGTRSRRSLLLAALALGSLGGGRADLGIGVSTRAVVEGQHGMPFDSPLSQARAALDELVPARAPAAEAFDDRRLEARVDGSVRVHLGALGPRMLGLAAARADGVVLNFASLGGLADWRSGVLADAPAGFEVHAVVRAAVSTDPTARSDARERFRRELAWYLRVPSYARAFTAAGHGSIVEDVAAATSRAGTLAAVTDGIVDDVALVGRPHEVAERVADLVTHDIHPILLPIVPVGDHVAVAEQTRSLAAAIGRPSTTRSAAP